MMITLLILLNWWNGVAVVTRITGGEVVFTSLILAVFLGLSISCYDQ
jgi:hypothetical protein